MKASHDGHFERHDGLNKLAGIAEQFLYEQGGC
jgi:hypothetical protein